MYLCSERFDSMMLMSDDLGENPLKRSHKEYLDSSDCESTKVCKDEEIDPDSLKYISQPRK